MVGRSDTILSAPRTLRSDSAVRQGFESLRVLGCRYSWLANDSRYNLSALTAFAK